MMNDYPIVIGHDPGNSGALVCLQGRSIVGYMQLTTKAKRVNTGLVRDWLISMPRPYVFITEDLHGTERNTPTANWMLSRAESAVVTVATILNCNMAYVTPEVWHKGILRGLPTNGTDQIKSSTVSWVSEKYPELASVLQTKANGDIADALCIAEFGTRLIKRGRL